MRLDVDAIDRFKRLIKPTGIPYQSLVNLYLADCAANQRELALAWAQRNTAPAGEGGSGPPGWVWSRHAVRVVGHRVEHR